MARIKEVLLAVIVGGSGYHNEIGIGICLFTIQCCGQVKLLLGQILLDIVILDR